VGDTTTYSFSITDSDSFSWSFAATYPDCGSGSLVSSSINNGAKTGTFQCNFGSAGTTSVNVEVTDGTKTSNLLSQPVTVSDTTSPTIQFSQTPDGNSNWFKTAPASVTVTATDVDDNISAISCTLDGNPVTLSNTSGIGTSGTASGVISTSADGDHAVSCTATDSHSNTSSAHTTDLKLDQTDPVVGCTAPTPDYAGGGGWFGENVSVPCTASDATSGLAGSATFDLGPTTIASGAYGSQTLGPQTVYDVAGNSASTSSYPLQIDLENPTIYDDGTTDTTTGFDGTLYWYNHDVTENFSANDFGGSGLAGSCASPWTAKTSGEGKGLTVFSGTCSDNVANTNGGAYVPVGGYNVDKTAPVVSVTGVVNGATYTLGSVPTAGCSTTDALSGVQTAATLSTSGAPVGSITATCGGALDYAGNPGSASVTYTVDYNWTGFFQPVDNQPTCNTVKAGSAIPVKFSLSGYQGMNIFWTGYPKSVVASCATQTTDAIEDTVTAGGSSLNYDATTDQYIYVWKTDKSWAGTSRMLVVRLADGTYHYANFTFTK
jgi:hypothetical protein